MRKHGNSNSQTSTATVDDRQKKFFSTLQIGGVLVKEKKKKGGLEGFRIILLIAGIIIMIVLVALLIKDSSRTKLFDDVPESHWSYHYVENLVNAGIIVIPDDKMFYGEQNITRGDMAQLTANLLLKLSPDSTADAKRITDEAAPDGDKTIDRYEIAVMVADVYKKLHKGDLPAETKDFKDVPADHFASESVNLLTAEDLMEGYSNGTFRGERNMSRYEAAGLIGKVYRRLSS